MKCSMRSMILVLFFVFALGSQKLFSQSLDQTFGSDGISSIPLNVNGYGIGTAIAEQNDGKIVTAGYASNMNTLNGAIVVRYNANGTLDPTFGTLGITTTFLPDTNVVITGLVIQNDRKIILGGYSFTSSDDNRFLLIRYNTDGSLDSSFGVNGISSPPNNGHSSYANAIELQPDEKILLAGSIGDFAGVLRFNTDGSIDNSFGQNGETVYQIAGSANSISSIKIKSDGKIITAGNYYADPYYNFIVEQLDSSGQLDLAFTGNSIQKTSIGNGNNYLSSVQETSNGKIIAGGYYNNGLTTDCAILRYTSDGMLDTSFGNQGVTTLHVSLPEDQVQKILIQSDGKILVGGFAKGSPSVQSFILRFTANGDVDNSFGTNGILLDGNAISVPAIESMGLQSDDKFLTTGYNFPGIGVSRFNSEGSLDNSFNFGNQTQALWGITDNRVYSITTQNDGKVIAVGSSNNSIDNDFFVVRTNSDGTLDSTFGGTGIFTIPVGSHGGVANSVLVQNDNKIIIAGYANNGTNNNFALVRFNTDGILDNNFGNSGIVKTQNLSSDILTSAALQTNQMIVAAGFSYNGSNDVFAIARYDTSGNLDNTFSSNGFIFTPIGSGNSEAIKVLIQTDGKIVAVGNSFNGSFTQAALVRYKYNGDLDSTFGSNGIAQALIGSTDDNISGAVLQSDGKIVIGGYTFNNGNYDILLVRFKSDGVIDSTFGTNGYLISPVGSSHDFANSLSIQSDGKLILSGYTQNGSRFNNFVMRFNTDGTVDNTFGSNGILISIWGTSSEFTYASTLQSDGNILTGGFASNGGTYSPFTIIRYINTSALPVELSSFSASVSGQNVNLVWATATEVNNLGFEIERSKVKGQNSNNEWEKLSFVKGAGNSQTSHSYQYTDSDLNDGKFEYRLKQINLDGSFTYSNIVNAEIISTVKYTLEQNYPNPFNPTTTISYSLPKASNVKLTIYNLLGQEVTTLVNSFNDAGKHSVQFNASNLSSGVYIYSIKADKFSATKKLLLLK